MKIAEIKMLNDGDSIVHKWYGICTIQKIMWQSGELFGVVIRPDTPEGKALLRRHTGTDIPDMLESSPRMLRAMTRAR